MLKAIKLVLLVYGLVLIFFTIACFVQAKNFSEGNMQSLWNKLTPFSKEYFDSQLKKLVDKNKYNMYLNAIYHLISGILVIVLFVFIYNIESLKGDIKGFKRDPGHDEGNKNSACLFRFKLQIVDAFCIIFLTFSPIFCLFVCFCAGLTRCKTHTWVDTNQ